MRMRRLTTATALGLVTLATTATAIESDEPMLCAPGGYMECTSNGCERVDASDINGPTFMLVDADERTITPVQGQTDVVSVIDHVEILDGRLMLQGVEDGIEDVRDGLGYTIAVDLESGQMTFSSSADGAAFLAFGACTALPD